MNVSTGLLWHRVNHGKILSLLFPVTEQNHCHESTWMATGDSVALICLKKLWSRPDFSLFNISTVSHDTTCKNALKSVGSFLKPEHCCSLLTRHCSAQPWLTTELSFGGVFEKANPAIKLSPAGSFYLWAATHKIKLVLSCSKLQDRKFFWQWRILKTLFIHPSVSLVTLVEGNLSFRRNTLGKLLIVLLGIRVNAEFLSTLGVILRVVLCRAGSWTWWSLWVHFNSRYFLILTPCWWFAGTNPTLLWTSTAYEVFTEYFLHMK